VPRDFRKVKAWQLADDLAVQVYQTTTEAVAEGHREQGTVPFPAGRRREMGTVPNGPPHSATATTTFPKQETHGLTQQLRRAAVSVPSDIAEGCSRHSKTEYLRFCDIARGSIAEARYQLHLARRLDYVSPTEYAPLESQAEAVTKALHGLMKPIQRET